MLDINFLFHSFLVLLVLKLCSSAARRLSEKLLITFTKASFKASGETKYLVLSALCWFFVGITLFVYFSKVYFLITNN